MNLADALNPTLELSMTETRKVLEYIRSWDLFVRELVDHRVQLPAEVESRLGEVVVARLELDKVWEG